MAIEKFKAAKESELSSLVESAIKTSVGYYDSKIIDGARDIKDWKDFSDCGICTSNHGSYTIIHKSCWETANPHVTWNCAGRIDCGIDEVRFYQVITPRL